MDIRFFSSLEILMEPFQLLEPEDGSLALKCQLRHQLPHSIQLINKLLDILQDTMEWTSQLFMELVTCHHNGREVKSLD